MCYGSMIWSRVQKARKTHDCDTCSRQILPGVRYQNSGSKDGSEMLTQKLCARCVARLGVLASEADDGCIFGDVTDGARDSAKLDGWKRFRVKARKFRNAVFGMKEA